MKKPKKAKDWADQIRFDYAFARRTLLERGSVQPMFIIHGADEMVLFPAAFGDVGDKNLCANIARALAIAHDAACVSFISEAWGRSVARAPRETEAEWRDRFSAIAPSKAEDRQEIIVVFTNWRDRDGELHAAARTGEIVRNAAGKPVALSELSNGEGSPEGRFVNLLPPERPTAEEREIARAVLSEIGVTRLAALAS